MKETFLINGIFILAANFIWLLIFPKVHLGTLLFKEPKEYIISIFLWLFLLTGIFFISISIS